MNDTINFYKKLTQNTQLTLALIPTQDVVLFPGNTRNFEVESDASLNAVRTALETDKLVFLSARLDSSKDSIMDNISGVGVIARIEEALMLSADTINVSVRALCRASLESFAEQNAQSSFLYVNVKPMDEPENTMPLSAQTALMDTIKAAFIKVLKQYGNISRESLQAISGITSPYMLVNTVMGKLQTELKDALEVLLAAQLEEQLVKVKELLEIELVKIEVEAKLHQDTLRQIGREQKEHILRQTQRQIAMQLGEDEDEERFLYFEKKIKALKLSKEDEKKLLNELASLQRMPPSTQEAYILESHLEFIASLPKMKKHKFRFDLQKAREILDEGQYGLDEVKQRILQTLAVTLLSQKPPVNVLCLVGAPGVGKTMIASNIAKVMKRKFCKMSLGGLGDESEIRGHRKTYIGAMSGKILSSLALAGSSDPVFLLDEIDKLSKDYKGDPASALLEALDPNQNTQFTDRYAEVSYDLSGVFFIATANTTSTIPKPLLDRMEIIEIPGYSDEEKLHIARDYQLPALKKSHGLNDADITITDEALLDIITGYTRESGVRDLERKLAKILRICAVQEVKHPKGQHHITTENLKHYLKEDFEYLIDDASHTNIGVMKGLAYTSAGGDTLDVEVAAYEGQNELKLTGNLGTVLKESAMAALSHIHANKNLYGLEEKDFKNKTLHIHVPEGATPKDGPSAGITLSLAILSTLKHRKAQAGLAMTGEISLSGKVWPVGGLKEKLLAAKRAGVKEVILPMENKREIYAFPKEYTQGLEIHYVSSIKEANAFIRWSE